MGLRRVAAAVWSGLCLAAMVAVPPWALVVWFGNPLPADPPQQQYLHEWIAALGVLFAWTLWLGLVALLVWHVRLALRRVRLPHLRVVASPDGLLAGLVGAVVVGTVTVASRGTAVPATTPAVVTAAQPLPAPDLAVHEDHRRSAGTPRQDTRPSSAGAGSVEPNGTGVSVAGAVGVSVPGGGWLPTDVARAVAAASAVVWVRRRRRYLPGPIAGTDPADADLAALPETVQAITAGWLDQTRTDSPGASGHGPGALVAPDTAMQGSIGWAAAGPLRPQHLPPGAVGLAGPGAADAARGVLTAALLTNPSRPSAPVQVVTTMRAVVGLLGPAPLPHQLPGLTICADPAELPHLLETQILRRHRASTTRPTADPAARSGPAGDLLPLFVVAVVPQERDVARRLAVALTASRLGIHGLLLGAWEHGPTWHVDADGHVHTDTGTDGGSRLRMCTVPVHTARDLLTLHALAHPTAADAQPAHSRTSAPVDIGQPGAAAPQRVHPTVADRSGAVLRVRLLGPVTVTARADGPPMPVELQRPRRAALQILVLLALHPDGAASADLAAALWPGEHPRPVKRVYNPASTLRSALQQATGRDVLTREGEVYRLDTRHVDVDLWQLDAALAQARATPDRDLRIRALSTVVEVYTGELAAGRPWPWITTHRELLRRRVLDAYTELAATADPPSAATLLTRALDVDPYNEQLHQQLIAAHTAAGHPDAIAPLIAAYSARLAALGEPATHDTTHPTG